MTDAVGGGRGGVGIRLFVSGGEVVKRTFDKVGDSGKKMWAEIALGEKAANPALRAMSRASGEAQGAVQGLGARAGIAGTALGAFGAGGVIAAAGLGGLILALNQTRAALNFADEIDDSASRIGIGVEALQEWRFAAVDVGLAAADADSAIEGFQKKLGEALAGGRSVKWFERLGFSREDLKAFSSTEDALEAVIDKISDLSSEAERAAVSDKLGLGPLITLVRAGGEAIDEMRARARDLGVVMDESMIKRAGEANREIEILSQVIDLQLKQAFIDLAPAIVTALGLVAELATALADVMDAWRDLDSKTARGLREERGRVIAERDQIVGAYGAGSLNGRPVVGRPVAGQTYRNDLPISAMRGGPRLPSADFNPLLNLQIPGPNSRTTPRPRPQYMDAGEHFDNLNRRAAQIDAELAERSARRTVRPAGGTGLIDTAAPARAGGGGGGSGDRAAEAIARERERALERLQKDSESAERRALQEQYSADTAEDRATLALALLELDKVERDARRAALEAELERTGGLDEAAKLQLEQLRAMDMSADALAEQAIVDRERLELAEREQERDEARAERTITLLELELDLAGSAQERVAIARRILLAEHALERSIKEAALRADGVFSDDDRNTMGDLVRGQGIELEVFDHNTREDLRQEFVSYGQSIVQAVEDGRLGEEIGDQLKARLIEMALSGLFDFLSPGNGQGPAAQASSVWSTVATVASSLFGGKGPGRVGGGGAFPGMRHPVVEDGRPELLMIGGKGQVTSAAETARLLREAFDGGAGGANGVRPVVHRHNHNYDFSGAVMTQDLVDQMNAAARRAETNAVGKSLNAARRNAPGLQQSQRRLGTT